MDNWKELFANEDDLKASFKAYERDREIGSHNMLDVKAGCRETGLTSEQYIFVLTNYSELMEKFPEVRK